MQPTPSSDCYKQKPKQNKNHTTQTTKSNNSKKKQNPIEHSTHDFESNF